MFNYTEHRCSIHTESETSKRLTDDITLYVLQLTHSHGVCVSMSLANNGEKLIWVTNTLLLVLPLYM